MEDKLKELRGELGMVRHIESIRRAQLQEGNEMLKNKLQDGNLKGETSCQFWKDSSSKKVP